MTEGETVLILAKIEANWQAVKNQQAAIDLWASAFKDDDFRLVDLAVMNLIQTDTSEFRPTIAKVRRKMHDLVYGERISEVEAWQKVKQALPKAQERPETRGGAKEAWQTLPKDIQRLVSPRQLYEYNSIPAETMDTVIQSNFMRSFREIRDRQYEKEALPKGMQDAIKALRDASGVYRDPDKIEALPAPKKPTVIGIGFEPPEYMKASVEAWTAEGVPVAEIRRRCLNWG